MSETLLSVRNLDVSYYSSRGTFRALNKVSVDIGYGEVLAVVGETGCGKSTFGSAIPRLLPFPGEVDGGEIILEGENLLTKTEEGMREVRRHKVAVIFQDATASLNPVFRIGKQLASSIQAASRQGSKETGAETVRMLSEAGIADAAKVARQYPHELSGGMRQRVVIAIALARSPRLLIADEPTSNLDVTIQAQIVDLIMELRERMGMSIILIAHSMGLVAQTCDRVGVMYAGNLVEVGSAVDVFKEPQHPYTRGLLELAALIEEEGQLRTIPGARAIAVNPAFLFLDEPTSALDVSVQGQILNLLRAIQGEFELAYLFVTHDIQVVKYMADDVAVMYLGRIMETGPKEAIFDNPRHPYTKALFSAVPVPDPESKSVRIVLQGETPTPIDPPAGCRFYQRCWAAEPGRCDVEEPALLAPAGASNAAGSHLVACHFRDQDLRPASAAGRTP